MLLSSIVFALTTPESGAAQRLRGAGRAPDDSTAIAAVLERVAAGQRFTRPSSNAPLRFDPRPLLPDPDILSISALADLPLARRAKLARRARVARRVGFREGDIQGYSGCPGILVAGPPDMRGGRMPPAGCPSSDVVLVILSAPRAGGAYTPDGADHRSTAPAGAWTVRVIIRHLTEWGGSSSAADAVLTRNAAGVWSVAQYLPLYIEE